MKKDDKNTDNDNVNYKSSVRMEDAVLNIFKRTTTINKPLVDCSNSTLFSFLSLNQIKTFKHTYLSIPK